MLTWVPTPVKAKAKRSISPVILICPYRWSYPKATDNQDNDNHNYGARFNYSEPVMKDRFLDLIYSYNFPLPGTTGRPITVCPAAIWNHAPLLSNAYENTFINQRVGANIRTVKRSIIIRSVSISSR